MIFSRLSIFDFTIIFITTARQRHTGRTGNGGCLRCCEVVAFFCCPHIIFYTFIPRVLFPVFDRSVLSRVLWGGSILHQRIPSSQHGTDQKRYLGEKVFHLLLLTGRLLASVRLCMGGWLREVNERWYGAMY